MQDGPFGWLWQPLWRCRVAPPSLHLLFPISQTSTSPVGHHNIYCASSHWALQQLGRFLPERGRTKDTRGYSRYVFRATAQRPPVCLQVSRQLAGLSKLFGDWLWAKRWRRIVMLMYLPPAPLRGSSSSYVLIDWAPASVALFNPVGLARALLTHSMRCPRRWQEDLPLILADIGQSSQLGCNRDHVKPQFPRGEFWWALNMIVLPISGLKCWAQTWVVVVFFFFYLMGRQF